MLNTLEVKNKSVKSDQIFSKWLNFLPTKTFYRPIFFTDQYFLPTKIFINKKQIEIRIEDDDECTQDEEDNQEDGLNQEEADKENVDEDNFETVIYESEMVIVNEVNNID